MFKRNKIYPLIFITVGCLFLSLLIVEYVLRQNYYNTYGTARELDWMRANYRKSGIYTLDKNFGFRPKLGTDYYSEYGTLLQGYDSRKAIDRKRVLFIGDSVTAQGYIVDGLRKLYGEQFFQYWNAGVGSYNTVQIVRFYEEYNYNVEPSHVIYTFHLNDFETTPVAFFNADEELVVFAPNTTIKKINRFLFQVSMVYRLYLSNRIKKMQDPRRTIHEEVFASLRKLRDRLKDKSIAFTVLINPTLKPISEWNDSDAKAHEQITIMLKDLEIRYFDLTAVLDDAFALSIPMCRKDVWHPSKEMGRLYADYLFEKELLSY